jgi:PAS domain S-box-containing protein
VRSAVLGLRQPDDDRIVWVLASADPDIDGDGALTEVVATFTDITERRRAERELEATALRLNEAQRIAHIGSWELDLTTNTLMWSDEIYRIFEMDPAAFGASYEAFLEAVHPEDRDRVNAAYAGSLATRTPYSIDHRLLLPGEAGGRVRHVHEQCATFFDGDRAIRSLGTVQDVTERKLAEEALRERESFIRNILDSVDEGFIVVDPGLRVIAANRAYCDSVGLPEQGVIGRPCYEIGHRSTLPCFAAGAECPVQRTFATGEGHRGAQTRCDAQGRERHLELRSYPVTDATGAVASAIETIIDVTERRRLEDQLHQAQKMEAIGTLAGGVAHDFNNLLTGIIGYGGMMQLELGADHPQQASLTEILAAADRAAQLTHGLLAFSRKQVINPKPLDLKDIVRNVEKLLRRVIGEDVDLTTTLSGGALVVMADEGQIEQVLMNLATNGRDAMPKGGRLSITARPCNLAADRPGAYGDVKRGRYAQLVVADSGTGMDESAREKAFEPFFTTKEVGRGTGLGLAIVFGIIKQHGGDIGLESEPGRGTTVTILLPLLEPSVEEPQAVSLSPPARGSETILFAEDDRTVRTLLGSVLRDFGYRVIEAVDGADALELFAANEPAIDLLIIDVVLPKKSGRDVYDAVRARREDLRTLFISGYTADIIHKQGILDEGLDFIAKPLRPFDLLRRVRTILDTPI